MKAWILTELEKLHYPLELMQFMILQNLLWQK